MFDQPGRDPVEPGSKRNAAPLEPSEVGERLLKDVSGHVLRVGASRDSPRDIGVDPIEVPRVEIGEAARIMVRSLDESFLVEPSLARY